MTPSTPDRIGLSLYVDWRGRVQRVEIKTSSGEPHLDRLVRRRARFLTFEPATLYGVPTGVWVSQTSFAFE